MLGLPHVTSSQQQSKLNRQRELSEIQKQQIAQRETGFQVYLMGANEARVKDYRIREQVERKKTPAIRQRWVPNMRPKWAKPRTPLVFKEAATTPSHAGSTTTLSSKVHDSPESAYGNATLATAANFVLASRTPSRDVSSLTARIGKLSEAKRSRFLQMLSKLEEDEDFQESQGND